LVPLAISLDSARQVLGVIASSIIGVGGVAFSITMVALTLTSGQYGPKILRSFLEDGLSKLTLGLFLGVYVYTLIVLAGYSQTDRPQLTIIVSLVLAFSALLAFVGFIHRTATDLQADNIIHRIGRQLQRTLRDLVADDAFLGRSQTIRTWRRAARGYRPLPVASTVAGYVQTIDYGGLVAWCVTNDCVLQVRTRAGDFVVEGLCLFKIFGYNSEGTDDVVEQLNARIVVGPLRTPVEDPEYAITQLSQLAARALSPGINDPGTAITCVDWFTLGLARVVDHDLPGCVFLDQEKRPRLLCRGVSFQGILKAIYAPLRQFSKSDIAVTARLLESLYRLGALTRRSGRLNALAQQAEQIWHQARRQPVSDEDMQDLHHRYIRVRSLLLVVQGSTQ
jgi:uncharacterized membrane protein